MEAAFTLEIMVKENLLYNFMDCLALITILAFE